MVDEGSREGRREGGRKGGKEGGREGGKEGGREGRREGGSKSAWPVYVLLFLSHLKETRQGHVARAGAKCGVGNLCDRMKAMDSGTSWIPCPPFLPPSLPPSLFSWLLGE